MIGEGPHLIFLTSKLDEETKKYYTSDGKEVSSNIYVKHVNKIDDLDDAEKEMMLMHYQELLKMKSNIRQILNKVEG